MPAHLTISDNQITVGLDARSGSVVAIEAVPGGIQLSDDRRGTLFVLDAPLDSERTIVVAAQEQTLSRYGFKSDGRRIELEWERLVASNSAPIVGRVEVATAPSSDRMSSGMGNK